MIIGKCIIFLFFFFSFLVSQQSFSEAPIIIKDGERFTNLIHFKFKNEVILPETSEETTLHDSKLMSELLTFKNILNENLNLLEVEANDVIIKRTFRKRDESIKPISAMKMNRIYSLLFPELINLERLIIQLSYLDIIDYCHGPVEAVDLSFPDDPDYANGGQWSLTTGLGIDAPNAWSITHGSSNIIIGLIELRGYPKNSLTELDSVVTKKSGGGFSDGAHATRVASIAGAETDNGTRMASINANGSIYAYTCNQTSNRSTLAAAIDTAISDGVNIINMSFKTVKGVGTTCDGPPDKTKK